MEDLVEDSDANHSTGLRDSTSPPEKEIPGPAEDRASESTGGAVLGPPAIFAEQVSLQRDM